MVVLHSTYRLLLMVLLATWVRGESEDTTCADIGGTCVPQDDNSCSFEVDYPGCDEAQMCCNSSASFLSGQSDDPCDDVKSQCKKKHGYCIKKGDECNGQKKHSWCHGKKCYCCIPIATNIQEITLYAELNQKGAQFTAKGPHYWLIYQGFDDKTKSVRGKGLWFLYLHPYFNTRIRPLASGSIKSQNLPASLWNQVSSVRFAGSYDMSMEILTMYRDSDQGGGSYIVVAEFDFLFEFNDVASSFAITGNSAWTVYTDPRYSGDSSCIQPAVVDGLFYGFWNAADIKIGNDMVSSVKKGCHSNNVYTFQPLELE